MTLPEHDYGALQAAIETGARDKQLQVRERERERERERDCLPPPLGISNGWAAKAREPHPTGGCGAHQSSERQQPTQVPS